MMIKSTSPSLHRVNNDAEYSIKYHNTVVLKCDKSANSFTLTTGGWETVNTARAMTFGLQDAGIEGHVEYRKNKNEQGLYLVLDGNRFKIYNGITIYL